MSLELSPEVTDLLRQQEVLRRFIESISGELELRPLLTRIVRHACELIGADHGSIGLVDDERQVVRTEATYRMPPSELGSEMAPGVGLAGQVYLTKQPLVLDRYGEVEHPTQPGLLDHAVIGLPIFWRGHMIGFCGIGADAPRRFSAQDVKTLSVFARHAAVAIENARRYEREQRRIERLALIARIGRIVTADLMLDDLLQRAADAIHDLLGYPNIGIALIFPEEPHTLVIRTLGGHYRNILRGEYRQSVDEGILGAAVRERRVLLINDVEADPRFIRTPGSSGIVAELAVPILLADRVLGVLNVESPGPFTDEDAASLEIIADQLAVAIENARLFSRVKDALDETKLLYDTSRRIGAAMDVDDVVAVYLEQMAVHGRYPCVVALHEPGGASGPDGAPRHRWWLRGRWTPQRGIEYLSQPFPYPGQTLDELLDAGQVVTIADADGDPRVSDELRRHHRDSPALALIPLMARGSPIGLVALCHPQPHTWPDAELRPYQATAAQLAVAIDHRRQQRLLYERGQQLATLEERQRLARELHDSVTQLIFSTTLIAQSIGPAWARDRAEGERRIQRLLELSRSALAEMRLLLFEMRAPEAGEAPGIVRVQRDGLAAALRQHVESLAADGLRVELDTHAYASQPLGHEETLYRIAQEALNNVVKHGQASRVRLTLGAGNGAVRLVVADDGVGFPLGQTSTGGPAAPGAAGVTSSGGFGLRTMRERAASLGGQLLLRSTPGRGTTVEAILPATNQRSEERVP